MKVSVQVPLFNTEDYIEPCLRSIMQSTPEDAEIYVYDDGSSDNSWNIACQVANEDSRFKMERTLVNTRGDVTYRMIESTNAEYIAMFDCDDIMIPGHLNRAISLLASHPDAVAVYGKDLQSVKTPKGNWQIQGEFGCEMSYFRMAYSNLMSRGTIVVRRDLFLKTDYREQTKLADGSAGTATDYLIAANLLTAGKVLFLDDYAMLYRRHEKSESSRAGIVGWHESRKYIQQSGLKKYGSQVEKLLQTGKLSPHDIPTVMYCLGIICHNRNQDDPQLRKFLLLAERIFPNDYYVQLCLTENYLRSQQITEALSHYCKFLDLKLYSSQIFNMATEVNKLFTEYGIHLPEQEEYQKQVKQYTVNSMKSVMRMVERLNSLLKTDFYFKL